MCTKAIIITLGLVCNLATAQQIEAPKLRNHPTPAALPAAASSQQSATTLPTSINAVGVQAKPAPGVVMLSDVAKQTPAEPPKVGAIQATVAEVQPIQVLDASGKPVDAGIQKIAAIPAHSITLTRISTVGAAKSALLWVKGQQRAVTSGAQVLQYIVGEIREDGVCLYHGGRKESVKLKCTTFVTFAQGV